MSQTVTFTVPLPSGKLGPNGRAHWREQARLKADYQEAVWIAAYADMNAPEDCPWAKAAVRYDWYSTHEPDADNAIARMKPALDVLTTKGRRCLGLIEDDRGVPITFGWQRVRKRHLEGVLISVTHVE